MVFGSYRRPQRVLDHPFHTFIFQNSPIMLLGFVGRHRPPEDQSISNNSFVLALLAGVALLF